METMKKSLFLITFTLSILFSAAIVSAAPSIVAWSSSGGNPTYKDNPQDLIYKVEKGDEITFTVTTDEPCDHIWRISRANYPIPLMGKVEYKIGKMRVMFVSKIEKNVKTSNITLKVPNETATWEVEVECIGRRAAVGPTRGSHKTWTITTSVIKIVNPDESIQDAIDSLPPEGGVIELVEGTYNLSNAPIVAEYEQWGETWKLNILINRSNVVLRGQGINKTKLIGALIGVNRYGLPGPRNEWHYFHKDESWLLTPYKNRINWSDICRYIVFKDFHVEEGVILFDETLDTLISDVRVDAAGASNPRAPSIALFTSLNGLIKRCVTTGRFPYISKSRACSMIDCDVIGGYGRWLEGGGAGINTGREYDDYSEDLPEYPSLWTNFFGCIAREFSGPLYFYSFEGSGIIGELGEGGCISYCLFEDFDHSVSIAQSFGITFSHNIIRRAKKDIEGEGSLRIQPHSSDNYVVGNLIYDNVGHGICVWSGDVGENHIIGNVIWNCTGDGIHNPENRSLTLKNNIIVNNKGIGIYGQFKSISYNDVYGNEGGNYGGGASAGTGDFSADPLFADPENGDFHLRSQYGRWNGTAWVKDNITSPCIDAGDPADKYSNEPDYPNGRINLGAYGNTREASFGSTLSTGTLKGKVTDKDTRLPIAGALIEANSHQTLTNSSGSYTITLPAGNYTIKASKLGYLPESKTITISENQTIALNFSLSGINLHLNIKTTKDNYSIGEVVNLTDPAEEDDNFPYLYNFLKLIFGRFLICLKN